MTAQIRIAFALICALALAGCGHMPSQPAQALMDGLHRSHEKAIEAAARTAPVPAGVWAHEISDIPPDPAIRFGKLPNGMRYALMRNATPTGEASLRLRIDAGSMMESDVQQGLAHFLEHMAFEGSEHVAQGEMIKTLERHGLAFGADTNASTAWDETVYKLDLPHTDDETVDTSLMLLREIAGELTLEPSGIDRERGIVLSEERLRDTPGMRLFRARLGFVLKDQLAAGRLPIGKIEVVQGVQRPMLADLYDKYYRPERATLVAVGDFDLDAMEAKIKARFSTWTAKGPAGPEPQPGAPAKRGFEPLEIVQPGAPLTIGFAWVDPADLSPDTRAKERTETLQRLGLAVLNHRLERLARGDAPPFIGGSADRQDEFRSAEVTTLTLTADAGEWRRALTAGVREQRRLMQYGVRQDELDQEIAESRAAFQAGVASAATRKTQALANGIANSVDDRSVASSPAEDLALFEDNVKGLTADAVSKAVRTLFTGSGPLLFVATPTPIEGDEAAITETYKQAQAAPVEAPTVGGSKVWPYLQFGQPSPVLEQKDVIDLNTVFVRFGNGVRLTVKPTKFHDDQVLVSVRLGDGRRTLPLPLPLPLATAAWAAPGSFIEGGLKALSSEELEQVLASNIVGANLQVDDEGFILQGATRPEDLDLQMQLLAAYVTAPGYRPEALARIKTYGASLLDQFDATPQTVVKRDLAGLLHGGDPRWTYPTRAQIAGVKSTDVIDLLQPAFQNGPIEVIVVGDTTVDKAIAAVQATFGALPPRQPPAAATVNPAFPAPTTGPVILHHKGRDDQAIGMVAWPTTDFYADMRTARMLRVLTQVLQLRLIDQLRQTQSATYSPSAGYFPSMTFPGYGYLSASVEIPSEKLDGFFADVSKIAADLRGRDVGPDELERARGPRVESVEKAMQTNEFWVSGLTGAQLDLRRLDALRSSVSGLQRVTPADIRRAAQTYLVDDKAWKLEVLPQAPGMAGPAAKTKPEGKPEPEGTKAKSPFSRMIPKFKFGK